MQECFKVTKLEAMKASAKRGVEARGEEWAACEAAYHEMFVALLNAHTALSERQRAGAT